jgi:hypothetical protein
MNHNHRLFGFRWHPSILLAALVFNSCGLCTLVAAEVKLSASAIVKETQISKNETNQLTLVWWLPEEYWKASFASSSSITESQQEKFFQLMRPYVLVAVVHGEIGLFGTVAYQDEKTIRESLALVDGDGLSHKPVPAQNYNAELESFLTMMKPVMAKMLGPFGENLNFYVFDAKSGKGVAIANPTKEGKFSILLGEDKFTWRLPLSSLLPPKVCPKCHESLSGAFNFCPYDGTPLPKSGLSE